MLLCATCQVDPLIFYRITALDTKYIELELAFHIQFLICFKCPGTLLPKGGADDFVAESPVGSFEVTLTNAGHMSFLDWNAATDPSKSYHHTIIQFEALQDIL